MAEFKTYSDHSMSLLMGDREPILKSILRQLFEGIYEEIKDKCTLDYAITLCAEEVCPVISHSAKSLHWMNEDPANETYTKQQLESSFGNTRENLYKLIKKILY